MRLKQKMQSPGLGKMNRWMSHLQKPKDEIKFARTSLEGKSSPVTAEENTKNNSLACHQSQGTSLMITSDENSPPVTQNNLLTAVERQEPEAAVDSYLEI